MAKTFLRAIMTLVLCVSIFGGNVVSANAMDKKVVNMEKIESNDESDTGHHSANTALGLTSDQMGPTLQDSASSEDNWYHFTVPANTKVTTLLESPTGSDYDLVLYTYDDANSYITPVAASGYSGDGVLDRISYVSSSQTVYFLQVKPVTAATASDAYIYFIVRTDSVFDSNEPNDNISQAYGNYKNSLSVSGTIDNGFDCDFYKFTSDSQKKYKLSLDGVSSDATYSVAIYNSSYNVVTEIQSSGESSKDITLDAGTYYLSVISYNGVYSTSANYTLKLIPYSTGSSVIYTTKGGHVVEITSDAVYVDSKKVDLNWSFEYNLLYIRRQTFTTTSSTKVDAESYQNGTFKDGQNMNSSSDCIRVMINNFNMHYYCNNPHESWDKCFGSNEWTYFYIDANTGKTIGTDANYYHTDMGIYNSFNKF